MKRVILSMAFLLFVTLSFSNPINMGATVATNHLWQGSEVADGEVITSSISVDSANHWAATNLVGEYREDDNVVSYSHERFTLDLRDRYNFPTIVTYNDKEFFDYDSLTIGRFFDITSKYRFGIKFPLLLSWSTILFGHDRDVDDRYNRHSTYCYAEYLIYKNEVWSVDGGVGAAFALKSEASGANFHGDRSGVVELKLNVTNNVKIRNYTLPISILAMWNPQGNEGHLQLVAQVVSF